MNGNVLTLLGIAVVLLLLAGMYCLLMTRNLIRTLIGLELMTKGITLLLILTGYLSKQTALAQALVITLIVIEVAVVVVAAGLIVCVFGTHRSVRRSRSGAERFFAMRLAIFSWVAGFAFLVALLFLPNKQRVLLMIPIFLLSVTIAKLWRTGRARLRREEAKRGSFERMKRVN